MNLNIKTISESATLRIFMFLQNFVWFTLYYDFIDVSKVSLFFELFVKCIKKIKNCCFKKAKNTKSNTKPKKYKLWIQKKSYICFVSDKKRWIMYSSIDLVFIQVFVLIQLYMDKNLMLSFYVVWKNKKIPFILNLNYETFKNLQILNNVSDIFFVK